MEREHLKEFMKRNYNNRNGMSYELIHKNNELVNYYVYLNIKGYDQLLFMSLIVYDEGLVVVDFVFEQSIRTMEYLESINKFNERSSAFKCFLNNQNHLVLNKNRFSCYKIRGLKMFIDQCIAMLCHDETRTLFSSLELFLKNMDLKTLIH